MRLLKILVIVLTAILSLSQSSADKIELQGTQNVYYRVFTNESTLCFQYKTNKNWSAPKIIDEKVSEYTMTITSGDYVHIVWVKQGRLYYKTNIYGITQKDTIRWECNVAISPYFCEPASNISIDSKGEYVNVTWSAPAKDDPATQEIWRRARWLGNTPLDWETPECLSEPHSKLR